MSTWGFEVLERSRVCQPIIGRDGLSLPESRQDLRVSVDYCIWVITPKLNSCRERTRIGGEGHRSYPKFRNGKGSKADSECLLSLEPSLLFSQSSACQSGKLGGHRPRVLRLLGWSGSRTICHGREALTPCEIQNLTLKASTSTTYARNKITDHRLSFFSGHCYVVCAEEKQ